MITTLQILEVVQRYTPKDYIKKLEAQRAWLPFQINLSSDNLNMRSENIQEFEARYKRNCQKPFSEFVLASHNFGDLVKEWCKIAFEINQ